MAKRRTTGKRDREKLKEQKLQEKQKLKDKRKSGGTSSFEDMIAYVDENGILHTTPQDVKPKTEIDVSQIEISTPKQEEMEMKKKTYRIEERSLKLPNLYHLDACRQGGNIYRNKKKYTRKGKSRFDYRKEY